MAFKLVAFACFVAAASAGVVPVAQYASPVQYAHPVQYAAPIAKVAYQAPVQYAAAPVKYVSQPEVYAPAQYNFEYSVHDGVSGDVKSQQESRNGDNVQGSYSLVEADGTRRIVDYSASEEHGFNAVVRHEGQAAPVAKIAYSAAPIAKVAYPAPVQYAAPAVHSYAAPAVHSYAAPAVHSYAAPAVHSYAAPAVHAYAAPVAKVAYASAPAVTSVSFSSPIASYHH